MVGFGKIMHLEVTKMTDGSTIKLVPAGGGLLENFASGNGQQKACISLSVIFMKFLLHPATYHVTVIIWKSKRTTENVRFNFQYLMFQYLI